MKLRSIVRAGRRGLALLLAACLLASAPLAVADHAGTDVRRYDPPLAAIEPPPAAAQAAVDAAQRTLAAFMADPHQDRLREHLPDAHAVLIVSKLVRAGFGFFGGAIGRGVLLLREASGGWSAPAFYLIGGASVGLEVGVQRAEAILVATTEQGAGALMNDKLQIGLGISIAAGPVGGGAQAASADVLVFERAQGLYGGLALEGAGIDYDAPRNHAYYGRDVDAAAILREGRVSHQGTRGLIEDLGHAAGG